MARVLYSGVNENGQPSEVMLGCAIGDIIPHFGTTAPPGTLVCDGSEVSREAYAELYEEIGALVGQGDGSTTFNLPDLRGKWLMGADAEHAAGTEVAEGLPNITGKVGLCSPPENNINLIRYTTDCFSSSFTEADENGELGYSAALAPTHRNILFLDAQGSSSIYGASQHVTPASVAVLPCIVYE